MLSSLALRSFIFHPNQWLVVKATRQAPAKPAYPPRPPCARKFLQPCPVAGKLFSRPFSRQLGGRINAMYVDKLDGRVDGAFFDKLSAAQHSSSISSFELGQVRMITYATADEAQHALARQQRVQEAPGVLHQIRQWLDVAA